MRKSGNSFRLVSVLMATGSLLALPAVAFAQTQTTPTEDESAATPPAEAPAEENQILVTGIRASLQSALRAKENSAQIRDVISAEDIGKLPDTNVAESLQRVTGVQINRDLGEGSEVAVRGFSANRVEINGQSQLGSGSQGAVSFNSIPSEAFKSIEVIKTPAADEIEGALGAIVRFNTRKPLDNGGRMILSASGKMQYSERVDKWTPNVNFVASKGWDVGDGGQFGVFLSYTQNERKLRQDFFDTRGWEAANQGDFDLDGDGIRGTTTTGSVTRFNDPVVRNSDGIITDLGDGLYVPFQTRVRVIEQDRKLQSWTTALQYKPNDDVEIYANGTYSRNRANDRQYQLTANFSNIVVTDPVNGVSLGTQYATPSSHVISDNQTLLSAFLGRAVVNSRTGAITYTGVPFNISGSSNPPQQDVWTAQFGVKFPLSERLKVDVQGTAGKGTQYNQFINTTSTLTNAERPFFFFDFGADSTIPTFVPLQTNIGGVPVTGFSDAARFDFSRPGIYNLANITVQRENQRNTEVSMRLDFDWEIDSGWLKTVEFGGRWARSTASRYRVTGRDANVAGDGTLAPAIFSTLIANEPGLIAPVPFNNILNGASGDFPTSWLLPDPRFLKANLDALFTKYGVSFGLRDPFYGFSGERDDLAAYLKGNFEFDLGAMPVYGNIGVRYISTDRSTQGVRPSGISGAEIANFTSVDFSYDKWLPSLNMVMQPANRLYVRFGAARSIARPQLFDASPLLINSPSFDQARGGNPLLRPQDVWQADLSIEKYYGKGNLLAVALFYKDFQERIEDGVTAACLPADTNPGTDTTPATDTCLFGQDLTRIEQPVNAGGAKVKGLEVSWQQSLDFLPSPLDGFGFIANYTYVNADGASISPTGALLPVQDLSKHSYNLIGYYEKGPFQARAAYNWRSKFYDERTDTNQASFAKPYGQLDASVSLDLTRNISVTAEALNILNDPEERYQELEERFLSYRLNDRRFLFGIRIKN